MRLQVTLPCFSLCPGAHPSGWPPILQVSNVEPLVQLIFMARDFLLPYNHYRHALDLDAIVCQFARRVVPLLFGTGQPARPCLAEPWRFHGGLEALQRLAFDSSRPCRSLQQVRGGGCGPSHVGVYRYPCARPVWRPCSRPVAA